MSQEDFRYDVIIEKGHAAENQRIHDFLMPRIEPPWLDVGCNTGWLLEDVAGGMGIDATREMVVLACLKGLLVQHGRAERLPFDDDAFATVVLSSVLEQCDDPDTALQEALRVSRGKVIGVNPYPDSPWGHGTASRWVQNVFEPEEFATRWEATIERVSKTTWYFEMGGL